MTLNDLTVNFRHLNRDQLLSDWRWLIGATKLPILITAFGDTFVQDIHDDSIHFLDALEGDMIEAASSPDEFSELLSNKDFVVEHFAVQAVGDLRQSGCVLAPGQVYSFKHPPILGGALELSNIEPTDISVHFSLIGQIHEQVRKLPPGTPISQISFK